jgi:8-oxo-dGTP pyrophosphatase MutT (NUDIX family)
MIEGLLRAVRAARDFQPRRYLRLALGGCEVGWVRRDQAERLRAWPDLFVFSDEKIRLRQAEEPALSAAIDSVAQSLARDGAVRGWRGETYAVRAATDGAPLFRIERAAMRFFGLRFAAAHLNGFVLQNENPIIWVARRSSTKAIDPGMLDNLVAGGVLSGEQPGEALLRECGEEAGIPPELAEKARPAGALRVCRDVPEGLNDEVLHIHDLALPADFSPVNADGEVSEFRPLGAPALFECISGGEMSVEAGLVAADFALRHGLVRDGTGTLGAAILACRDVTSP